MELTFAAAKKHDKARIDKAHFLWLRYLVLLALSLPVSCSAQSLNQVALRIDDANLTDGRVRFRANSCDLQPTPAVEELQGMAQASTPHYIVYVNVNNPSIFFGSFIYEFYVRLRGVPQSAQVCAFRVQATPSGAFADQMADVAVHVGLEKRSLEDATVTIPIHNSSYKQPILRAQPPTPFAPASLSGHYPIPVKISNLLPDLQVAITGISVTPGNPSYWQDPPAATLHLTRRGIMALEPQETLDAGIEVTLVPNRWHALGASIFPIAPDKAQETLHMSVNFNTPGGIPGTLEVPLPVRFKPSFWNLSIAVLIGAALGSGLGLLMPQKNPGIKWYKALIVACALGIIAEAIGIVLVNGNSEFRLLGFELDPYQLLPASLIGVLVGLAGFRSAKDFLDVFKKKGAP